MKSRVKKEKILNKREKRFDFKGLFKNLVSDVHEELSEEEVILNDTTLSEQDKKDLIAVTNKYFSDNIEIVKHMGTSKGRAKLELEKNMQDKKNNKNEKVIKNINKDDYIR